MTEEELEKERKRKIYINTLRGLFAVSALSLMTMAVGFIYGKDKGYEEAVTDLLESIELCGLEETVVTLLKERNK